MPFVVNIFAIFVRFSNLLQNTVRKLLDVATVGANQGSNRMENVSVAKRLRLPGASAKKTRPKADIRLLNKSKVSPAATAAGKFRRKSFDRAC